MRPERCPVPAFLVLWVLLVPALAAGLELSVSEEYPLRGESVRLILTGEGADAARTVSVTYRPNSQTAHEDTLAVDGPELDWTPRDAGIVRLVVRDASGAVLTNRHVAVRFGRFPPSGLAVMLVAATLLFGGAILGFVALLREPATPTEEQMEPPST